MPLTYQRSKETNGKIKRSDSYFELSNSRYTPVATDKPLGIGASGLVRLFANKDQHKKVVKKPLPHNASLKDAKRELKYYQLLYPGLEVYIDDKNKDDYRLVMPYLGQDIMEYSKDLPLADIQRILNKCLTQMRRIHALNINHNDIHPANILIADNGKVYFIDGITAKFQQMYHKDDVRQLSLCFSTVINSRYPGAYFDDKSIDTIEKLEARLRSNIYTYNNISFMDMHKAQTMFTPEYSFNYEKYKKEKTLISDFKKQLKQLSLDDSIHKNCLKLIDKIRFALVHEELEEKSAKRLFKETLNLITKPYCYETLKDYLNTANYLKGKAYPRLRCIGKTMCAISTTVLALSLALPVISAPLAVISGICLGLSLLLTYLTSKSDLQNQMETIALKQIQNPASAKLEAFKLAIS